MRWRSAFGPATALCLMALLWFWYMAAANYSYQWLAGTYDYRGASVTSTLALHQDGAFEQHGTFGIERKSSSGTWRRVGEGGVVFSKEFLSIPGESVRKDGQVDGIVTKRFLGFFPQIDLSIDGGGPVFKRKIL